MAERVLERIHGLVACRLGLISAARVADAMVEAESEGGSLLEHLRDRSLITGDQVELIRRVAEREASRAEPTLALSWDGEGALVAEVDQEAVTLEQPGRYRYDDTGDEIGRGGIGRVLRARDLHLARDVALKELLPGGSGQDSAPTAGTVVTRFLREARITGQLEHPGIVPVHELGRRADGTLYYTMKLVRGRTLSTALRAAGSLDERLALLPHFVDLCQAVAYAHSRGVIHRDIKPQNVMLGEFGETVVLDWGLVKLRETREPEDGEASLSGSPLLTRHGLAVGTPAYMSPEQARGNPDEVDERTDVWSLGAVLYELLTGGRVATTEVVPRFEEELADTPGSTLLPTPLPQGKAQPSALEPVFAADVPEELADIARKALADSPDDRYQSAHRLAQEVSAWLTGGRVGAHEYTSMELLSRFVARNRAASVAALLIFALTVGAAVLLSISRQRAVDASNRAEQARVAAEASDREAQANLALGFQEKADRLLYERDQLGAGVFAAAALVHDPANPRSAWYDPDRPPADLSRASSALYASALAATIAHDGTVLAGSKTTAVSPDGALVASGDLSSVTVRRVDTGEVLATWPTPGEASGVLAITPAGRVLYTVRDVGHFLAETDGTVLWKDEVTEGTRLQGCSPDGTVLALTYRDRHIRLLDVATGQTLGTLRGHQEPVMSMAFSPDGRLATVGLAEDVRIWSLDTMEALEILHFPAEGVAWAPDGSTLALSDGGGQVFLWTPGSEPIGLGSAHRAPTRRLAFSRDGRVLASGDSMGVVHLWSEGQERTRVPALSHRTHQLVFTDDHLITASWREVERWRLRDEVAVHTANPEWINQLTPFRDGVLSASDDGTVRWWERSGEVGLVDGGGAEVLAVDVRGDQAALCRYDGSVEVVGVEDGETRLGFQHRAPCWAASISPGGDVLVTGHQDGDIVLHALNSGERLPGPPPHSAFVKSVALSPDGELLLSAELGEILRLVSVDDLSEVYSTRILYNGLTTAVFSPDGTKMVVSGMEISLRAVPAGEVLFQLEGHQGHSAYAAFSPSGELVATGAEDGDVRVWEVATGRSRLVLHPDSVNGLAFVTDELLAVAVGGEVRFYPVVLDLWDRPPAELLQEAEARAGARLEGFSRVRTSAAD